MKKIKNVLSIEGSSLSEKQLTLFAEEYPKAELVHVRHMGAEPFTVKLFLVALVAVIPKIAQLYIKLREIDQKCKVKIDGIEIEGIRSAREIKDIISSIKGVIKQDD